MAFKVLLTKDAIRDLEELYDYIVHKDGEKRATQILDRIEKVFLSLTKTPKRGAHVKELSAIGIREFREIFFKPYRIIYRVAEKSVYIMLITDGRRDMQALLQRRLLER